MGLGWCVSLSFLAAACTAGCGRFSFQSSDANDALADDASGLDDYFALAPPPFSTTDDVFTPVPGSQIGLDVRPADRPWIIWMSATLGSTLGDEMSVELRYTINGVERGYAGVQNLVPERRGSFHHFVAVDTSADTATLEVQLRDASGGTATVEQLRIVGFVAPPGADIHYSEVNTPVAVTTTSPAEYHRLTLTPSAPGTYVVFGAVAGSEVPSTAADVEVRWVDDIDGTVFPAPRYMNHRCSDSARCAGEISVGWIAA